LGNSAFILKLQNYYGRKRARVFQRNIYNLRNPGAIISFTFDDFPRTAYLAGGEILRKYNFKGTYFASLGLMGKESPVGTLFYDVDLINLMNDGHEIGCHTYDHVDASEGDASRFEDSILKNQSALSQLLPGLYFKTLAYPKNNPHPKIKKLAGGYFKCCRGGGQAHNSHRVDVNMLKSVFIDFKNRDDIIALRTLIDINEKEKGWLIFSTHDICDSPSSFGCTPALFHDIVTYVADSGASVLTVFDVYSKYVACVQR
jgi:peptidoglycan/xylan/chitin deacetylase (PgdA/CDA1 family)